MTELTVEQRLDRLEKYANISCWRCEKTISIKEAHFEPHYGYLYLNTSHGDIALCHDCYSDYQELVGTKEQETREALSSYMKEIKRKKYNLKY
jgi:hypothetical protein